MSQDIYPQLKEIIKPYLPEDVNPDAISHESHLVTDLNINSTHLVDIVLDVEYAFDITIEDDELEFVACEKFCFFKTRIYVLSQREKKN